MVRNYKPKTERTKISEENMEKAIDDIVKNKVSVRDAAIKYDLSKSTLFNRLKKVRKNKTDCVTNINYKFQSKYTSQQIFTAEQELLLRNYLISCSQLNYGLTCANTRNFAYQYANHLKIFIPESWEENKMAGIDWLQHFMHRHTELSLRKPEKTSVGRASAFTAAAVKAFMDNYDTVMSKYHFTPENIYNLDETGITTVMDPPKVISQRGQKQVAQAASSERGQLVTMCSIVNAIGNSLPPVFIFPRHKYKDYFLKGAPPGSKGCATPSGWMNGDIFLETLKHFQKHSRSSKEHPVLIILDNHESHTALEAILYCRENGIELLTFPPHTSHRLQPLDVAVFGAFKANVKSAMNDWMMNNPGKRLTIYDIPEISNFAYKASFTIKNILSGFKSAGIWPINHNIFDENDFLPSQVTQEHKTESNVVNSSPSAELARKDLDSQESVTVSDEADLSGTLCMNQQQSLICDLQTTLLPNGSSLTTPESLRPLPKYNRKYAIKRRGRKCGKTRILTSTPEKNLIQDKANQQKAKKKHSVPKKEALAAKKAKYNIKIDSDSDSERSLDFNVDSNSECESYDDIDLYQKLKIFDPSTDALQVNDFVLVKFLAKNFVGSKPIHYIGQIDRIGKKEINVSFLRRKGKLWNFIFPESADASAINLNDIVIKLPSPISLPGTSTRSYTTLKFCTDLQDYDVR